MPKPLQCGLIVLLASLLFSPPRMTAAADTDISVVQDLLAQLWNYQRANQADKTHVAFDIPEVLVNQYIAYLINTKARLGMSEAIIKIIDKNKVKVACNLDLRQIRTWQPAVISAESPLNGKDNLQANLTAAVNINNGTANVSILSATDSGGGELDLPVIRDLLRVVASNQPEHFDIDKAIKLPFNLTVALADGVVYGKTPARRR